MACAQEVLLIYEEIVKCFKERFVLLNKLNIFREHNRSAECAGRGVVEESEGQWRKRVISSLWKLVCSVALPG